GLMIRTFRALVHVPPGFSGQDSGQTFRYYITESEIPEPGPERVVRTHQQILNKPAAIPGVTSVSATTGIPLDGNDSYDPIFAQDRTYAEGELPPVRRFQW